jgi:hypothetical protein
MLHYKLTQWQLFTVPNTDTQYPLSHPTLYTHHMLYQTQTLNTHSHTPISTLTICCTKHRHSIHTLTPHYIHSPYAVPNTDTQYTLSHPTIHNHHMLYQTQTLNTHSHTPIYTLTICCTKHSHSVPTFTSKWSLILRFPTEILSSPQVCYMLYLSDSSQFAHPYSIGLAAQINKLLSM